MLEASVFVGLLSAGYIARRHAQRAAAAGARPAPAAVALPPAVLAADAPSARTVHDSGRYFDAAVRADEARRAAAAAAAAAAALERPAAALRSELSGEVMPVEAFTHANMTPFYRGGAPRQDTRAGRALPALEAFTGGWDRGPKREAGPLFEPAPQVGVASPFAALEGELGHLQPPRARNNELPFERVVVGRPHHLAGGTSPTGDVYYDMRPAAMPRATDERRVASAPKLTYEGRVLPGAATTVERAPLPELPDPRRAPAPRDVGSPDHWLRTTGAVAGAAARPEARASDTARAATGERSYVGPALSADAASRAALRSAQATSVGAHRTELGAPAPGPAHAPQRGAGAYVSGRDAVQVYANARDVTTARTYQGGVAAAVKALVAPVLDGLRATGKEGMLDAPRPEGHVGVAVPRAPPAGGDGDVPRTTAKDAGLWDASAQAANLAAAAPARVTVHDPSDVARTTVKQAGLHDPAAAAANLAGALRVTVYDPEDVARVTAKQAALRDASGGAGSLAAAAPARAPAHDPEDVARTTGKETGLHDGSGGAGSLAAAAPARAPAHDPEDVARTTAKDVGLHDGSGMGAPGPARRKGRAVAPGDAARATARATLDRPEPTRNMAGGAARGGARDPLALRLPPTTRQALADQLGDGARGAAAAGAARAAGGAYATTDARAPLTQRQQLSDQGGGAYHGGAGGAGAAADGYRVAAAEAPGTQRAQLADHEHYGAPEGGAERRPADRAAALAARTSAARELVAEGRAPAGSSTRLGPGEGGLPTRDARAVDDGAMPPAAPRAAGVAASPSHLGEATRSDRSLALDAAAATAAERVADAADGLSGQHAGNPLALPPLALRGARA